MINVFCMSSRLGLLHTPQRQTTLNTGVEDGPQAILSEEFTAELGLVLKEFQYSSPDEVAAEEYYDIFAREANEAKQLFHNTLAGTSGNSPVSVAIGGDHSVSLAHIAALLETVAEPEHTGIVMMDSHADINLFSSSPTGNIHGMWLRPLVDHFDIGTINALVERKIPAKQLLYIGNLDLDSAERTFIDERGIHVISVQQLRDNPDEVQQFFSKWSAQFAHLHFSVDIDAFDHTIAPATGIPCPDGLLFADAVPILNTVKSLRKWSLDLVEVNPRKDGAAQTVAVAQQLLRTLLTGQ